MNKKVIAILALVVVIGLIAFTLIGNKKKINESKKPAETKNIVIPVNSIEVIAQVMEQQLIKTGNLIPYKEADITSLSSGNLVAVNFALGNNVSQGSVLAETDNKALRLNLETAELAKAKAEKDYKRFKALLEGEAATEVNFLDAKLNYDNAVNQIELLKKQIDDSRIKAPISGTIISKTKERGEFVGVGTVLGHIVDISKLKANVYVSENDVYSLKQGQKVKITTEIYPEVVFEGKVTFVSNKGDNTHNYLVEIEMNNDSKNPLKAGTFAYVEFSQSSNESVIAIPRTALVESLKNPYVYIVENGEAKYRKVSIGRVFGDNIEITDGLKEGERLIISGQFNISEGTKVK